MSRWFAMSRASLRRALAASAVLLLVPAGAHAAFPGANGRIAYSTYLQGGTGPYNYFQPALVSVKPDGSDLQRFGFSIGQYVEGATYSPSGAKIAYAMYGRLYVAEVAGTVATPVPLPPSVYANGPTFSADGTRLAFSGTAYPNPYSYYGASPDIYTVALDGTSLKNLTDSPAHSDGAPSWSPDGMRIAYSRDNRIATRNIDGTDEQLVTSFPSGSYGYDFGPDYSPSGSRLAFTRNGALATANTDGTDLQLLGVNASDPTYAPDGTRIAFTRFGSYPYYGSQVATIGVSGGTVSPVSPGTDNAYGPAWQPLPGGTTPPPVPPLAGPGNTTPGVVPTVKGKPPTGGSAAAVKVPSFANNKKVRDAYVSYVAGSAGERLLASGVKGLAQSVTSAQPVPSAGVLAVEVRTAPARKAGKSVSTVIASGQQVALAPGLVKLKIKPSKAGKAALKRARKTLKVQLRLTFTAAGGVSATTTINLTLRRR